MGDMLPGHTSHLELDQFLTLHHLHTHSLSQALRHSNSWVTFFLVFSFLGAALATMYTAITLRWWSQATPPVRPNKHERVASIAHVELRVQMWHLLQV